MKKLGNKINEVANNMVKWAWGLKSYPSLDRLTMGFHPGEVTIIAARPSQGKTSLAVNLALKMANEYNVLICSVEMGFQKMGERFIITNSKVDSMRVKNNILMEEERVKVRKSIEELKTMNLWIDDLMNANPETLDKILEENKIDIVFVDYLQLLGGLYDRNKELDLMCRDYKGLAKKYNIPIVILSQMNRQQELRTNKEPKLSDLRDAGMAETVADVVMFIYRPSTFEVQEADLPERDNGEAYIIVAKNRNGPTGRVNMLWVPQIMLFDEIEYKEFGT